VNMLSLSSASVLLWALNKLYHAYYSAFIQGRFLRLSNMVASQLVRGNLVPGH
jgi:hypothetical protein